MSRPTPRSRDGAGADRRRPRRAGDLKRGGGAHALFLLRLPAQPLDHGARGRARLRRHRLPFHGAVHGPRHRGLHPDGRRRRELDRRGAFLDAPPRVPESRRRHLQSFRRARLALGDRRQGQRHLQDPVQRRGGDDRRPAPRGRARPRRRSPRRSPPTAPSGSSSSPTIPANIRRRRAGRTASSSTRATNSIAVEKELAAIDGVTVLIYDQTCAAEKRRRRKRGQYPDPDKRVFINAARLRRLRRLRRQVELRLGPAARDRVRPQARASTSRAATRTSPASTASARRSSPSKARGRRQARRAGARRRPAPSPIPPSVDARPYAILVTGVGGTGVVTIGAMLGMAAHLEGKGAATIDMAGLAQKGGAVFSHVKIAARPEDIHAMRVARRRSRPRARLRSRRRRRASRRWRDARKRDRRRRQQRRTVPRRFHAPARFRAAGRAGQARRSGRARGDGARFIEATAAATALLGDSIGANMFMLGYAYQAGLRAAVGAAAHPARDRTERRGGRR